MSAPNEFSEREYPASATTPYGTNTTTTSDPVATTTRGDLKSATEDLKSQANATTSQAKDHLHASTSVAKDNLNAAGQQAQVKMQQAGAKIQDLANQAAKHPAVQQTQAQVQKQVAGIDRELSKYPLLNDLENRTHIPKTYLLLLIALPFLLIIIFNIFDLAKPITNLVGWVAPAVFSISALENGSLVGDKQWLTYWVVFGYINFLESFALKLILYYVPYYFLFKLVGTIWLMLPQTRGAEKVYHSAIRPAFRTISARATGSNTSSFSNTRGTTTPANTYSTTSPIVPDSHSGFTSVGAGLPTNGGISGTSSTGISTGVSGGMTSDGLVERPMAAKSNNPFVGATSGVAVSLESGVVGGPDIVI